MSRISLSSLRVRLLLLVLLATIPALVLIISTAWELRKLEADLARADALRLAQKASSDQERLIEGARQLLAGLARLPELRSGDAATCGARLAELLKSYPGYANFGVVKPNGDLLCSAVPAGAMVNAAERAWFQRALLNRDFAVGEYQIGRITRKAVLVFGYPILDERGTVQAVLFASLDLAWLNRLLAEFQLRPETSLAVIDSQGTVLAQFPDTGSVGRMVAEAPIVEAIREQKGEGVIEALGHDGTWRLFVLAPLSNRQGVYLTTSIPKAVAFRQANRAMARNLGVLGLIVLLALAVAWAGSDLLLLRRVRSLLEATKRLAEGDLSARSGLRYGADEISRLASAFDQMAATIESQHVKALRAEQELRRYAQRLQILHEIDRAILGARSDREIARVAVSHLRRLIPCQRVSIVLFDFNTSQAEFVTTDFNGDLGPKEGMVLPMQDFSNIDELKQTPTRYVEDIAALKVRAPVLDRLLSRGICCFITAPLLVRGELIGEVNLSATRPAAFSAEDREIAREVADQLAIAIRQAQLREQVERHAIELEERVRERTAELQAANKELESFSYSVSHDLRAPLRAIDGFSQALFEDYYEKLDVQGKGYIDRIRAACGRMAQLIDDLLSLSRVTRAEIRREEVDLSAMAHSIAEELRRTEPEREVEFAISPGLLARGDARLLHVVLQNLLSNAWKFTRKKAQARIELGVTEDNGRPVYFVRDNGAGFDMAYADKLFGAFQRLHSAREFEGTGIGLATVQRIIHRHGGRVWAEAAVGKGATFYFTL